MSRPAAVYRLYAADDSLLYVGVAYQPEERWRFEAGEKRWWHEVTRREVEWHPSREVAEAAEGAAILAENPRYNIKVPTGNGGYRVRKDAPSVAWATGRRPGVPLAEPPPATMPSGKAMPKVLIRVNPELWHDYGAACEALGINRSEDLRVMMKRRVRAWNRAQQGNGAGAER